LESVGQIRRRGNDDFLPWLGVRCDSQEQRRDCGAANPAALDVYCIHDSVSFIIPPGPGSGRGIRMRE
jgi:hypothetical protein